MAIYPHFKNKFLAAVVDAVKKRQKSLSRKGELGMLGQKDEGCEWLELSLVLHKGVVLIMVLGEDCVMNLYVRSNLRKNRGQVLSRHEGMTVVPNEVQIIKSFEKTVSFMESRYDQYELLKSNWKISLLEISKD